MTTRSKIRALLLPGIYMAGDKRGSDFTDAEIDGTVDAYFAAEAATPGAGAKGATAHMERLLAKTRH